MVLDGTAGWSMAERAMYVSTHFAVITVRSSLRVDGATDRLTYDGLLEFPFVVQVKQLAGPESEFHALAVLLEMIVDFGGDESGQLSFGKGLILVQSFSGGCHADVSY